MNTKIATYIKSFLQRITDWYKHSKLRYKIGIPILLILLMWYVFCLPSPLFDVPYSTVVNDRNGMLLGARIASDEQWRFPTADSVPEKYKTCLIEFEDRYFNYHWGVNPASVFRAIKQNLNGKRVVSGASTITMQTIRLSRKKDRTYWEKIIEMILATRLEFAYSKDEIVRLYASHAPMGGNVVGIEAASWRYFGHSSSSLSWSEAATLAVLPNSPALMHFGRNRDKLVEKRNRLLYRLHEKGVLDDVDYELAVTEPLPSHPLALPQTAPHLVTKIYLEEGGRQVRSTIEKSQQEHIEAILDRWNAEFAQNGINNIAAIVFDVERNEVVSYCGNVHFSKNISGNQVDIIQAPRSTGSILKPFLYQAMLQEGLLLPDQLLVDIPVNMSGFTPKNFSRKYDGAVAASEALARSLNIPSVICLRDYGVPKFRNFLQEAGMTTLTRTNEDYGLSLVLGGAEGKLWDISLMYLRMAQSLSDFNDSGMYYEHSLPKYLDEEDQSDKKTDSKPHFTAGAAWLTLNALTSVDRPEEIDIQSIPSIQRIAWKTGTSFGSRDAWAVGVTPRYVVGVWVGNSDGEGRPGLVGASTAGMVMFDIFNGLPKSPWFKIPTGDLRRIEVCRKSGFLRGINCPDDEIDEIFISPKGVEAEVCPFHKRVHLSQDKLFQVYEDCAGDRGIIHASWFVLPPSWEKYYRDKDASYMPLPPYSPECGKDSESRLMEFMYPEPNSVLSIPRQLDGSQGHIVFEIAHRIPSNCVFWHIDDQYIGETRDFHKKDYTPNPGKHKLTVVDEGGASVSLNFTIK